MSHLSTLIDRYQRSIEAGTDSWFQAVMNMIEYVSIPPINEYIEMREVIEANTIISALAEQSDVGERLLNLWNRAVNLGDLVVKMRAKGEAEPRIHAMLNTEIQSVLNGVDEMLKNNYEMEGGEAEM